LGIPQPLQDLGDVLVIEPASFGRITELAVIPGPLDAAV
jgi:hypothetical protein